MKLRHALIPIAVVIAILCVLVFSLTAEDAMDVVELPEKRPSIPPIVQYAVAPTGHHMMSHDFDGDGTADITILYTIKRTDNSVLGFKAPIEVPQGVGPGGYTDALHKTYKLMPLMVFQLDLNGWPEPTTTFP